MTKPGGHSKRLVESDRGGVWSWTWAPPQRTQRQVRRELAARRLQAQLRRAVPSATPSLADGDSAAS